MARIEDSIKAALYRTTCPDSATLGHYHLGLLSDEATGSIQKHLAICPLCSEELVQLEAFLAETAVAPQPATRERIKVWIAKRIPTGGAARGGLGTPTFAVRGNNTGPLMYEAGDAQLSLEVQDDPDHPGHKSILGLVLGIETDGVTVQLFNNDEEMETAVSLDELGNFTFASLESGTYRLSLSGNDLEIHVQGLSL